MSLITNLVSNLTSTALRTAAPWLLTGAVAGAGAIYLSGYRHGAEDGRNEIQAAWDKADLEATKKNEDAAIQYQNRERALQTNNQVTADALHLQLEQTETEFIVAIDAVRSDRNRLRKQFQGCAADLSASDSTTTTLGGNDGAATDGLSGEDQELVIRIGAEADAVSARLMACQQYVIDVRKALNPIPWRLPNK